MLGDCFKVNVSHVFPCYYVYLCYLCRVRAAACDCIVRLAPSFDLCEDMVLSLAKYHSTQLFLHLHHSSTGQLSWAGIGDTMDKDCPKPPLGLKNMLWFIEGKLRCMCVEKQYPFVLSQVQLILCSGQAYLIWVPYLTV